MTVIIAFPLGVKRSVSNSLPPWGKVSRLAVTDEGSKNVYHICYLRAIRESPLQSYFLQNTKQKREYKRNATILIIQTTIKTVGAIHESPVFVAVKFNAHFMSLHCGNNSLPPRGKVAKSLILTDEG